MNNIPAGTTSQFWLASDVSDEFQCPVCLLIPREVPIPACPVGHITCKDCRVNVTKCPTCRRQMLKDGTNSIANRMISLIPHPCKYGCPVKNYLKEIVEHEARCPERIVKCPFLRCDDMVKVKEYQKHAKAMENSCNGSSYNLSNIMISFFEFETTRESLQDALSHSCYWPMAAFKDQDKIFYFHVLYFSCEQTFAFYVTMAEHSSEAKKYLAKMTLKNLNDERKSLSMAQNVISIDSAPCDVKSVLASKSVMFVHWRTMSEFMKWRNIIGEEGKQVTLSNIEATIDILLN